MAANASVKARFDHLGIAYTEGNGAFTFSGATLSAAQFQSAVRAAEAQGYLPTLAAGVLTFTTRS